MIPRAVLSATVAALVGAVFGAAPAVAQSGGATPVIGGGSFVKAPLLGPGRYRDTILPAERLYYGVKLAAGQRLKVSAQLEGVDPSRFPDATGFSVGIQTPLREVDVLDAVDRDLAGNGSVTTDPTARLAFVTAPVLARSQAIRGGVVYRGPGTWYVSLYMPVAGTPPRVEFPVRLSLDVLGTPQPDPSPDRAPAKPAAAASPAAASGDEGTPTSTVVLLALGGLLLGALGGAVAGIATRRGSA